MRSRREGHVVDEVLEGQIPADENGHIRQVPGVRTRFVEEPVFTVFRSEVAARRLENWWLAAPGFVDMKRVRQ
jgi:hypothetical protein